VVYITEEINKGMLGSVVKNHDVLLNITGASIGRVTYVEKLDNANVNQHVCIIRPETVDYKFLSYYLTSRIGQDQIISSQMGTSWKD
jgi:type I restriction enzyme S subunit